MQVSLKDYLLPILFDNQKHESSSNCDKRQLKLRCKKILAENDYYFPSIQFPSLNDIDMTKSDLHQKINL